MELHAPVRILDEEIYRGSKYVAKKNCPQIGAHAKRFHFHRPLGVGKLEVRGRDQRLARGQNHERPNLPNNARTRTGIDAGLNHGDEEERRCRDK